MKVTGYRIHQWGGPLRWESFDVAPPRAGEVLVRVEACGIGLTVLNCIRGDLANEAARLPPADRVAVIGAGGGVGIHMVEMAALFGARVAGLEASEGKFDTIRRMGAVPILSRTFGEIDLSPAFDGERPTVVIDLLGSRASLAWALDALALGGRLVVLTTFRDVGLLVNPRDLVLREITLYGSRYASKAELRESAELVAAGRIHPVVSQVVPPAAIEEVHCALTDGTLIGRGAVDWTSWF